MDNQEKVHASLTEFDKAPSTDIPPVLEDFLKSVAKTGKTIFQWSELKALFVQKLEQVMEDFNKEIPFEHAAPRPNVENAKYGDMRKRIIDAMQKFNSAPFTVQRLCELITQPKKHYTQCDKLMRGIEKNVMVVSTVDPSGRKIVSESRVMVNGLDMNGVNQQRNDPNEFNDGQPFAPVPQIDWSSGHAVAMTAVDNVGDENASNTFNFTPENKKQTDSANGVASDIAGESDDVANSSNNNTSNDDSLVASDSVKLPPSSLLLSRLKHSIDSAKDRVSDVGSHAETLKGTNELDKASYSDTEDNKTTDKTDQGSGEFDSDKSDDMSELPEVFEESKEEILQQTRDIDTSDEPPEKKMRLNPDTESDIQSETTEEKAAPVSSDNDPEVNKDTDKDKTEPETSQSLKDGCTDSDTQPFVPTDGQMTACRSEDSLNIGTKDNDKSDKVQNFHGVVEDLKEQEREEARKIEAEEKKETEDESKEEDTVEVEKEEKVVEDQEKADDIAKTETETEATEAKSDDSSDTENASSDTPNEDNDESSTTTTTTTNADEAMQDNSHNENAENKAIDEAMETDAEEKTEKQSESESEPMDHE